MGEKRCESFLKEAKNCLFLKKYNEEYRFEKSIYKELVIRRLFSHIFNINGKESIVIESRESARKSHRILWGCLSAFRRSFRKIRESERHEKISAGHTNIPDTGENL